MDKQIRARFKRKATTATNVPEEEDFLGKTKVNIWKMWDQWEQVKSKLKEINISNG